MSEIVIALISATIPTLATIITIVANNNKNNALQDERIKSVKEDLCNLASKVEQHNNFGIKIAKLEARVESLEKEN